MPAHYEIRGDYDNQTIVMYQAFSPAIALPAVRNGRFIEPFSFNRMTWIKPSFLWLMERSNWGQKAGQEHILAVRIKRSGFDEALSLGVLAHPEKSVFPTTEAWKMAFDAAHVHVQWDPERSIRGATLPYESLQVGLSRHIIRRFVDEWITSIEDITPLVRKLYTLIKKGEVSHAVKALPKERVYPVNAETAKRLLISA